MGSATSASTTSGCARCGPTPYWTPTSAISVAVALLSMPTADDPAPEPRDEDHRRREICFAHLVLVEMGGYRRVEKDEVGPKVCDEPAIERRRKDPVDRQQEAKVAKLEEAADTRSFEVGPALALHDPGELRRVHAVAPGRRRGIEFVGGQEIAVERHEEHRRTGVLREGQRRGDERAGRDVRRAWQRLVPQVDTVDEVDHRLERDPEARRFHGSPGGCIAHDCGFHAVPTLIIGSAPISLVHVTPWHRAPTNPCRSRADPPAQLATRFPPSRRSGTPAGSALPASTTLLQSHPGRSRFSGAPLSIRIF